MQVWAKNINILDSDNNKIKKVLHTLSDIFVWNLHVKK